MFFSTTVRNLLLVCFVLLFPCFGHAERVPVPAPVQPPVGVTKLEMVEGSFTAGEKLFFRGRVFINGDAVRFVNENRTVPYLGMTMHISGSELSRELNPRVVNKGGPFEYFEVEAEFPEWKTWGEKEITVGLVWKGQRSNVVLVVLPPADGPGERQMLALAGELSALAPKVSAGTVSRDEYFDVLSRTACLIEAVANTPRSALPSADAQALGILTFHRERLMRAWELSMRKK